MALVYSAVSLKGGTGKTTLVKFLGYTLARQNNRVLIIDLCQNSDVATRLGYDRNLIEYDSHDWIIGKVTFEQAVIHDEETGLDFIPATERVDDIEKEVEKKFRLNSDLFLKEKLDTITDRYDYILLDTHPSENNRAFVYALCASDVALIPTIMDGSAVQGAKRTVEWVTDMQEAGLPIEYFVMPNAVDFTKGFGKYLNELLEKFKKEGINNFTTPIRNSSMLMKASLKNIVVGYQDPYIKKILDDYEDVLADIQKITVK